jgi:OFA family oxalate/formate antiporter-like MFS transporter
MATHQVPVSKYRWLVICASFVIMMIISIYQYSWFLFAYVIERELHWDVASIGLTFTIFAYAATFIQPFSGYISDSYGPRKVAMLASFLVGIGFILASFSSSPLVFYLFYGLGGLGVGVLYGISTACAVKWFPDKRGFSTGLVVFGFGAGTAIFNWFIQGLLDSKGLSTTLFLLGFLMIITLIPLSLLYTYPNEGWSSSFASRKQKVKFSGEYKPSEMLVTYQWFLIYFSFAVTVSIVLMFGAQMKMLAREFNIPTSYFNLVLILFPLGNGLSRVVSGAISDIIGRERTMVIFYSLLGLSIICFVSFGHIAVLFIIIVFIAALLGGAPFALYPATIGDYYGSRHATTNYGITYTAKAWAGLISGWLSGYMVMKFGSYRLPLVVVAICSLMAAVLSNPRLMKAPSKKQPASIYNKMG